MKTSLLCALISTSVGVSCASAGRPAMPIPTPAGVRFVMVNPGAQSVALAGSFNNWSTSANQLERDGSRGLWATIVRLPPGEHLFMFVVNGTTWTTPAAAEYYQDDGFGERNGVVVVK